MKKALVVYFLLSLLVAAGLMYAVIVQFNPRQSVIVTQPSPLPTATAVPDRNIRLLFGGDLMFDRNIRLKMEEKGVDFILAELQTTFQNYDSVVANLEGPVTPNLSRSVGSTPGSTNNFIFTFDAAVAGLLKQSNFQIVNLGNNHILNFGVEGVTQTKAYLDDNQVAYFGDTSTEASSRERTLLYPLKGKQLGFVNYNQFVINGLDNALADLAYLADKADLLIVYTHWGSEYMPQANQVITAQAHQLIEQGADLVIGSHPHVTQPMEEFQGKRIYYSLGNFVFDQYFSPETQTGLLVGVEIASDNSLSFSEIPIQLDRSGQTLLKP